MSASCELIGAFRRRSVIAATRLLCSLECKIYRTSIARYRYRVSESQFVRGKRCDNPFLGNGELIWIGARLHLEYDRLGRLVHRVCSKVSDRSDYATLYDKL